MINLFDEETAPMTDEEIQASFKISRRISLNIGSENAVTSKQIIEAMKGQGITLNGARLRKIINHIRRNKLVRNLVASSKGYYVETDQEKIRDYVDSLVQRAEAIREVAKSFEITV